MNKKYMITTLLTITVCLSALLIGSASLAMEPTFASLLAPACQDVNPSTQGNELCLAAFRGNLELIQELLAAGVPVDAKDYFDWTPLRHALHSGQTKAFQALIDANAQVNFQDDNGESLLMVAAIRGHKEISQLLINAKAHIDATNLNGVTTLMQAITGGKAEICRLLLTTNASIDPNALVNAKDRLGQTALMYAAATGHIEICQLLLEAKAQINAKDDTGLTPMAWAAQHTQKDVCKLFINQIIRIIKQNKAAAIALLGMKKFNKASCMKSNNKDEIQLIARQIFDPIEITNLFAEIDSCKNDEMRDFIRTYAQKQLNTSSQTK